MSEVRMREIAAADQAVLWDMLYLALFVAPGAPPFPRAILHEPMIARYAAGWGRAGDHGLLALAGDLPVGAAWVRLFTVEEPGYGFLGAGIPELTIAVLPAYRGRGIGGRLLERLLADLGGRFPAVSLSVVDINPACRLYERFGFVTVSAYADTLVMEKPLARNVG